VRRSALLALVAPLALVACGDDGDVSGDAERFCDEAAAHTSAIVAPPVSDEAGLVATLDFYRLMGELAPLSIAEEWNRLVEALEAANELVPGDPESEQYVAATAYAAEPAAYRVQVWLERNCGVTLPITTIAPHDPIPAITPTTPSTPPTTATP
jgi:hypothetical protein